MKSAMSSNALKRENTSASANVLMCKQWWKVCWMYGDQEKYYRQLYGKRAGKKFDDTRMYENTKQGFNLERDTPGINSLDLTREIDE